MNTAASKGVTTVAEPVQVQQSEHRHETTTTSQISKIVSVKTQDGDLTWMLLTIDRKLLQCNNVDGEPDVSDEVRLKLVLLGSIKGGHRPGDIVMEMRGEATSWSKLLRFSNGYIVVEDPWKGLRIGTYMMNMLVSWATKEYTDFQPFDIKLLTHQAANVEDKERRNRFYLQFGFRFDWDSTDYTSGTLAEDMRVHELSPVKPEKWQKTISEFDMVHGMEKVFGEVHPALLGVLHLKYHAKTMEIRCEALQTQLNKRQQYYIRSAWVRFGLTFLSGAAICWLALRHLRF